MALLSVFDSKKDPDVNSSIERISFHERSQNVNDQSNVENDDNPGGFTKASAWIFHSN